ncbi:hypothetical protein GCM10009860_04160 [Microbacterium mitrae]
MFCRILPLFCTSKVVKQTRHAVFLAPNADLLVQNTWGLVHNAGGACSAVIASVARPNGSSASGAVFCRILTLFCTSKVVKQPRHAVFLAPNADLLVHNTWGLVHNAECDGGGAGVRRRDGSTGRRSHGAAEPRASVTKERRNQREAEPRASETKERRNQRGMEPRASGTKERRNHGAAEPRASGPKRGGVTRPRKWALVAQVSRSLRPDLDYTGA